MNYTRQLLRTTYLFLIQTLSIVFVCLFELLSQLHDVLQVDALGSIFLLVITFALLFLLPSIHSLWNLWGSRYSPLRLLRLCIFGLGGLCFERCRFWLIHLF